MSVAQTGKAPVDEMLKNADVEVGPRWYQIPMVWMVIGIPLFSVISTLLIVWISIRTFDGVVVDDYYRRGMEINRDLARDRYANELNLQAAVSIDGRRLQVQFSGDDGTVWPMFLELFFYHPTVANRDVVVKLEHQHDGGYSATLANLRAGKWNVITGTESWRLQGTVYHPDDDGFSLHPVRSVNAVQ